MLVVKYDLSSKCRPTVARDVLPTVIGWTPRPTEGKDIIIRHKFSVVPGSNYVIRTR